MVACKIVSKFLLESWTTSIFHHAHIVELIQIIGGLDGIFKKWIVHPKVFIQDQAKGIDG